MQAPGLKESAALPLKGFIGPLVQRRRRSFSFKDPRHFSWGPVHVTRERLSLTLPVPPSINHQYATVNGRRVLAAAGRSYKATVAHQVLLGLARAPHRQTLLHALRTHDLSLSIRFYFASPLRRDVDSGLKIAQDALCEALGLNDNRVTEIHLYKSQDAHQPRIEISLGLQSS